MSAMLKKVFSGAAVALIMSATVATDANAIPIDQYASSVIGFSSQYPWGPGNSYTAVQALGAPDVLTTSQSPNGWLPSTFPSAGEFLSLGYTTAVYATGATITEAWQSGSIYQIDVIDTVNVLHTVWAGADPSVAYTISNLVVSWAQTSYLVKGLKIYTNNTGPSWTQIDAAMLSGTTAAIAVPNPATLALLGLGIFGLAVAKRRKMI